MPTRPLSDRGQHYDMGRRSQTDILILNDDICTLDMRENAGLQTAFDRIADQLISTVPSSRVQEYFRVDYPYISK
jgi:hypothetical protein